MIQIRKSKDRGYADHQWLKSYHTFSFAGYQDPQFMGFRSLRVINEDRIQGGKGFGSHPHKDMEILSYAITGALEHQDSMGNKTKILPGEIQKMNAGTGVVHSEFNPLPQQETHFLQIWIQPNQLHTQPGYSQKSFIKELETSNCVLTVSQNGRNGSLSIHQDADVYVCHLSPKQTLKFPVMPKRGQWIQMIQGSLKAQGALLEAGDGAAIEKESVLQMEAETECRFLLFDLN